jgi:hypothetical protein
MRRSVLVIPPCIPDSHPYRITSTKCGTDAVVSPHDGHTVARNMWRKEINVQRKIVNQVGCICKTECRTFVSQCHHCRTVSQCSCCNIVLPHSRIVNVCNPPARNEHVYTSHLGVGQTLCGRPYTIRKHILLTRGIQNEPPKWP